MTLLLTKSVQYCRHIAASEKTEAVGDAIGTIVASSETKEEQETMQADLTTEQAQLLARVTQQSQRFSHDIEAFHKSLEALENRNSHYSWEQEARR
jgi:ribulose kinase